MRAIPAEKQILFIRQCSPSSFIFSGSQLFLVQSHLEDNWQSPPPAAPVKYETFLRVRFLSAVRLELFSRTSARESTSFCAQYSISSSLQKKLLFKGVLEENWFFCFTLTKGLAKKNSCGTHGSSSQQLIQGEDITSFSSQFRKRIEFSVLSSTRLMMMAVVFKSYFSCLLLCVLLPFKRRNDPHSFPFSTQFFFCFFRFLFYFLLT